MLVISDTSPIICLALCNKLSILDELFDKICIPQSVFNELAVPNKPKTDEIIELAKSRIVSAKNSAVITALSQNLDLGESEAMSLYLETNADFLLIDDKKGRTIATRNGIRIIGTMGVLLWAKQKGFLIKIKPVLDLIMQTDYRISNNLYLQILDRAGE